MAKKPAHVSETPATAWLRRHGVGFTEHVYDYVEHGGTEESARQLGVPEHRVVKTLVMQDERAQPLIVLMHGDKQVSTKNLARQIGAKSVESCKPDVAQRHSGYQVGGTSPFGTRKAMPVYVEASVLGACRALGWVRAAASRGARRGAGEACGGPTQRAGNEGWRRESLRPGGLGLQGAQASLQMLAGYSIRLRFAPILRPLQAQRGPIPKPDRLQSCRRSASTAGGAAT